jgi:pyrimidine-nucleoside phosphorylase
MTFDTLSFISAKKSGLSHSPDEINSFIQAAVAGEIPDYQISAWLMAVCFQGLSFKETLALTQAMTNSGTVYSWDHDGPPVVDKHSTGGVGDTATLIAVPLIAAMGMRIGKHSGRGLGHTGGTIDKLESIPGFRTSISESGFRKIVDRVGCAITGQDKNMTPADGLLYSLRDVTSTVDQESLIASSIMSKKLAGGADVILLDVKVGSGAFMKDLETARSLSDLMIHLGKASGRRVRSLLTSMESPLGRSVGNALEVREAIQVLKGEVPEDDPLRLVSIEIAARLASMCGFGGIMQTRSTARTLLRNGGALDRFSEMIELQGGDMKVIVEPDRVLPRASRINKLLSPRSGFVSTCDALKIGELVRDLGGGRKSKGDTIDPAVGVILHIRPGMRVSRDDLLCEIHTNGAIDAGEITERMSEAIRISSKPVEPPRLFLN